MKPAARPSSAARNPRAGAPPATTGILDLREPWLVPALALVTLRLLAAYAVPLAAEDAYITFRYARNLAHGFGLVFNPGERVLGFSSPLWTLWSTLGFSIGMSPVLWTRLSSLAADLVVLFTFTALLRRHAGRPSAWCFAFFYAAWPYFSAVSVSGMEMTLMLALVGLAAFGIERRGWWTGSTLGALALVRPEGLVAAGVLAIWARNRDRLTGAAIATVGVIALALYFGSPIPQSVTAKSQLYGTPGPWAGRFWWEWLSPFVLGAFPSLMETGHLFLMAVVFAPAAVLGVRRLRSMRSTPLVAAIAACLVVWLGYAALGVAFFWWYLLVPLAGLAALAAVGMPSLASGRALYVSTALLVAGLWTVVPNLYIGRAQNEYFGFAQAAEILARGVTPGQKVMLEPIGLIGYRVPAVVIDEIGLVSPRVARRRLQGPGWYADLVASERPDWLVVRRGVLESGQGFAGAGAPFRSLSERDAVRAAFDVVGVADSTVSHDMALLVLRRR